MIVIKINKEIKAFCLLFYLFCILCSVSVLAQDKQQEHINTLHAKLAKAKEDTNKVYLYLNLLYEYLYFKPADGLKFEKPGLELAEKIGWKKGVMLIKNQVGRLHWRMGNFQDALKNHFEALQLSMEEGDEKFSASLLGAIGQDYADGGQYPQALIYTSKALRKYEEMGDKGNMSYMHGILSWIYSSQGNYAESSKSNYAALRICEELNDKEGVAVATSNLASNYFNLGNYTEALNYTQKSIKLLQESGDKINLGVSYNQNGKIYTILGNFSEALKNYLIGLKIGVEINENSLRAASHEGIGQVYQKKMNYTEALKYYSLAVEEFKSVSNNQSLSSIYSNMGICYSYMKKYDEAGKYSDKALVLSKELNSTISFLDYYRGRELLDSVTGNWEGAYKNFKQYIIFHDSTFNKESINKIVASQMEYDAEKKEAFEKAEQEKKDIRQRNIRNSIAAGLTGAIVFLVVVYKQRNKIREGKKRSDELLLNILPEEVADELKAKGSAAAKHFDEVTVMFTDFKGFTQISEKLTASELVSEIDYCFKAFDNIITKRNIEKIKTIGDAYMCAGGLPVSNTTHAGDVVQAAIEILEFMQQHLKERKMQGKEIFEIRIGIHTGPVVAGIVGVKKFAYDIWGDTVNTASRMESSGEAGKINISGSTYNLVKGLQDGQSEKFKFIHRGKIQAKNKGEIDMYFVESKE